MNFKINKYLNLIAGVLLSAFCSCRENPNDFKGSGGYPLSIYATIAGSEETRAITSEQMDDQWSYTDFQYGDEMGLFSSGGDMNVDDGAGPFNNQELIYDGSRFYDPNDKALFSPTHMKENEVFLYFPYDKNATDPGIPLRRKKDNEGVDRCVDLLSIPSLTIFDDTDKHAALFATMQHTFSEIIIIRGEGFDNPPTDDPKYQRITVVLSNPYTHYKITMDTDPWSCTRTLEYDEDTGLSKEEAKRWEAWQGLNFGVTQQNPVGDPAWYVVLPTLRENFSNVDYIELYDNEGYLQRISSMRLYGQTKTLEPAHRYPIKIIMKELVPTVNPFPILPWDDEVNLTDERKRGIDDLTVFSQWVSDYNAYLADKSDENKINALLKYGDKIIDDSGNISWHFYILSDLDLTKYTPLPYKDESDNEVNPGTDFDYIIPRLEDILDGISTTFVNGKFTNHTITGLNKTFIGEMTSRYGSNQLTSLQNITFVSPDINFSEENTTPAGILANSITNGSVLNCSVIKGKLSNPKGPVGVVAGTMTDGSVKDCIFSGSLTGSTTSSFEGSKYIIGEDPFNSTFSNNSTVDITSNLQSF